MERIVYILGTGFSAPAGIPTIRDFLTVANDLYRTNRQEFAYFKDVFDRLDTLGHVNTFYAADLKNIEDVLSMLEMRAFASTNLKDMIDLRLFEKFISSVVLEKTPKITGDFKLSFAQMVFNNSHQELLNLYSSFVLGLFNVELDLIESERNKPISNIDVPQIISTKNVDAPHYDVISLNYDTMLENSLEALVKHIVKDCNCEFSVNADKSKVLLAKLHGDANTGVLVCPTWNKSAVRDAEKQSIKDAWRGAYASLTSATQIRILGYSLPELDAYIRYLLKAAIHNSRDLTRIDVLCLDPGGDVEERYKKLIPGFSGFRFISANVQDYLNNCRPMKQRHTDPWRADLEFAHYYGARLKS